jgi:hypothetical protein
MATSQCNRPKRDATLPSLTPVKRIFRVPKTLRLAVGPVRGACPRHIANVPRANPWRACPEEGTPSPVVIGLPA